MSKEALRYISLESSRGQDWRCTLKSNQVTFKVPILGRITRTTTTTTKTRIEP